MTSNHDANFPHSNHVGNTDLQTASSSRPLAIKDEEDRAQWTSHFADSDADSTEVRVLQKEGDYLLETLSKVFPESKQDIWTFDTLRRAVLQSQQEWLSKSRIAGGKPQRLFHSLMKKFESYSNLCVVIPSGDKYVSLATGAITILVKASTKHSKTITQLSEALDIVTDAAEICQAQSKLIRSKAMQNAVAKFYIAIFLFFGDAAKWYKSQSVTKIINSLQNDFSETFRNSLTNIQRLAAEAQKITALGSAAEVRMTRLTLEELQEDICDLRIGQSGQIRMLAEYIRWQHEDNLEQHKKTQEMLDTLKQKTLVASQSQRSLVEENAEFSNSLSRGSESIEQREARLNQRNESSTSIADKSSQQNTIASASLEDALELSNLPDEDLVLPLWISAWTTSFGSPMLYIDCGMLVNPESQISIAVTQIIEFCHKPGRGCAIFQPKGDITKLDPVTGVTQLMSDLAHQITTSLDELQGNDAPSQTNDERVDATEVGVDIIADQLSAAINSIVLSFDLYLVVIEFPSVWDGSICLEHLTDLLHGNVYRPLSPLKVLFLSTSPIESLVYHLDEDEIMSPGAMAASGGLK